MQNNLKEKLLEESKDEDERLLSRENKGEKREGDDGSSSEGEPLSDTEGARNRGRGSPTLNSESDDDPNLIGIKRRRKLTPPEKEIFKVSKIVAPIYLIGSWLLFVFLSPEETLLKAFYASLIPIGLAAVLSIVLVGLVLMLELMRAHNKEPAKPSGWYTKLVLGCFLGMAALLIAPTILFSLLLGDLYAAIGLAILLTAVAAGIVYNHKAIARASHSFITMGFARWMKGLVTLALYCAPIVLPSVLFILVAKVTLLEGLFCPILMGMGLMPLISILRKKVMADERIGWRIGMSFLLLAGVSLPFTTTALLMVFAKWSFLSSALVGAAIELLLLVPVAVHNLRAESEWAQQEARSNPELEPLELDGLRGKNYGSVFVPNNGFDQQPVAAHSVAAGGDDDLSFDDALLVARPIEGGRRGYI